MKVRCVLTTVAEKNLGAGVDDDDAHLGRNVQRPTLNVQTFNCESTEAAGWTPDFHV
jgi:hypothetical protein